jgi:diguanylate cyclase (GGDEF)-like protein
MQSEILDITIIGCLVLLFGSTYRKRPSQMVGAWLLGWALILVHFAARLLHPSGVLAARLVSSISLISLLVCGLVFLSAPPRQDRQRSRSAPLWVLGLAGFGILICFVLAVCECKSPIAYFLAGASSTIAWLIYGFGVRHISLSVRLLLFAAVSATTYWFEWAIWHGQFDLVLSVLLTQVFILVGITFIGTVRRLSAGTLTVSLGLVAWATVFPAAVLLEQLRVGYRVHPEFWNIPKYFVAFGMMLMLLEDEIIVANEAGKSLLFQASHDQLTGLRNRATLEQDLKSAVEIARSESKKCALICFDLDRFKHINDTYGHGVGDICLRAAGERLSRLAFGSHTSARIGGEEFGLVLSGISHAKEAEGFGRQVELALKEPIQAESFLIEITASIGIAVFPDDGSDPAALWRNADSAMYRAKKTGGNQMVSMSPEILRLSSEANDMEMSLRRALREGGLELWFQPVFSVLEQIHSVEALVRLRHPEQGLILPSRFISVAEERGLIVPLGDWVFKQVCAQLATWRNLGIPLVPIAVNISAVEITSSNFAMGVLESLSEFDIDPSLIAMEITETAMLRNVLEASRQIEILADAGISFSIDDFGVGYSSLGQIDKLDVDNLKIDYSFVSRISAADETRSIVAAIISMAHALGLRVVAEGIEDQCTFDHLSGMGCDLFQGFFLGKPQPSEQMQRLLLGKKHVEGAPLRQGTAGVLRT